MAVAQFSVIPVTDGSLRPYIAAAVDEVRRSGLRFEVGAMATTVEGDLDQLLEVIRKAHDAVLAEGAERVVTSITIDDRTAGVTIEEKLEGLR